MPSLHERQTAMKEGPDRFRLAGIAVGCAALLCGTMAVLVFMTAPGSFRAASGDPTPPGASGLARPHAPLDRAPGEPLEVPFVGEKQARRPASNPR
jgi:hypothetical protein